MKRILTSLVLLVAAITVNAQNYTPFPSSNAIWTQREGQGDTTPIYMCYGITTEDTTLNIVTYHKLFRSADTLFQPSECVGGLREDSMKRIFYRDFASGQEHMLYDFSVQPGDTVDHNPGSAGLVDFIDSVDVSGVYHKRINFKSFGGNAWIYGSWIEGIGNASLGGLLNSAFLQPTCDCAQNMLCFKQNNAWAYHNPVFASTNCVNDALAVKNIAPAKTSVTIYPNPVTGSSTLRIDGLASQGMVNIYNLTGALMHSYVVSNNSSITINRSEYPSGIYYYRLNGTTVNGKFVVE